MTLTLCNKTADAHLQVRLCRTEVMNLLFVIVENFLILSHQTVTSIFSKSLRTRKGTFRNEVTKYSTTKTV